MRRIGLSVAALGVVTALSGCAVPPPTGPSVLALPSQGKPLDVFQREEAYCRQFALGGGSAQTAANAQDNSLGSAAIGTGLGAVAGALVGSASGQAGAGAAVGAGLGLLGGVAVGAGSAQQGGHVSQRQYDNSYTQCMYTYGNSVQAQQQQPVYVTHPSPYAYPPGVIMYGGPYRRYWW